MQRLIILLGHPTYSLSVVLFAVLVSSGIGSYLTQSGANIAPRMIALLAILVLTGLLTPTLIDRHVASPTATRIAIALLLLMPAGLFMGMCFPLGMQVAATRRAGPDRLVMGHQRRHERRRVGPLGGHLHDLGHQHDVVDRRRLLRPGPVSHHPSLIEPPPRNVRNSSAGIAPPSLDSAPSACYAPPPANGRQTSVRLVVCKIRTHHRGVAQLGLERLVRDQEVEGSNPFTPIRIDKGLKANRQRKS